MRAGDEIWIGPVELVLETLSSHDMELAVEIELPAEPQGSLARTTDVIGRPLDPRAGLWLRVTRLFFEHLADVSAESSAALAVLVEGLSVHGACLVESVPGREPTVLAACGRPRCLALVGRPATGAAGLDQLGQGPQMLQ